jgi:hypothetical protein
MGNFLFFFKKKAHGKQSIVFFIMQIADTAALSWVKEAKDMYICLP